MTTETVLREPAPRWTGTVWRWHFYAGLFCMPFVVWLSLTGTLYLWRPQVEHWLDARYDRMASASEGPVASAEAQVAAALRAVPGGRLHKYVLPETPRQAVRVLVDDRGEDRRVTLDPRTLAVLNVEREEGRPFRLLFHLHGELLVGAFGSYIVEIAACWTIVMLMTGLYLWWPRNASGLAGVLYPRLRGGRRIFWRDIHATAGIWVSIFALGLILTGLPWAKGFGSYLVALRNLTGTTQGAVDWSIGGKPPAQDMGEHAGHGMSGMSGMSGMAMHVRPPVQLDQLDRVVATSAGLGLAPPVLVSPPRRAGSQWSVTSDAADRPLRGEARVEGATGQVVSRTGFAQRHWIDRTIGIGVAAHEGALFGLANQLLGTTVAMLLALLSVAGGILWWRRRPDGVLGAPPRRKAPPFGTGLIVTIAGLGVAMPLFGASLVAVVVTERMLLRRLPGVRRWLGLGPARAAA